MHEQNCAWRRCLRRGDDIATIPTTDITLPNGETLIFCSERCHHDWVLDKSSRVAAQRELCYMHDVPWLLP